MKLRWTILIACFVITSAYLTQASKAEPTPDRTPLFALSMQIGSWNGQDANDITEKELELLGVTDYISRLYSTPGEFVGLYVGFYESQRQGAAIHSPLNCLPGAGWNPVERSYASIPVKSADGADRSIEINKIIIEQAGRRQLVMYWYQSHGRVIASEYWGKVYTVVDAIRINRTDSALVRIVVPMSGVDTEAEAAAEATATQFIQDLFPLLSDHLPE